MKRDDRSLSSFRARGATGRGFHRPAKGWSEQASDRLCVRVLAFTPEPRILGADLCGQVHVKRGVESGVSQVRGKAGATTHKLRRGSERMMVRRGTDAWRARPMLRFRAKSEFQIEIPACRSGKPAAAPRVRGSSSRKRAQSMSEQHALRPRATLVSAIILYFKLFGATACDLYTMPRCKTHRKRLFRFEFEYSKG